MSAIGKADLPGKGSVAGSTEYDPGAYELLKTIDDPAALRALDRRGLQRLAEELRTFILESVSQTGGHLSSNLGTVELTIALHHVFNTPHDRSEEHTSELQSRLHLVCRLLLEKKKKETRQYIDVYQLQK